MLQYCMLQGSFKDILFIFCYHVPTWGFMTYPKLFLYQLGPQTSKTNPPSPSVYSAFMASSLLVANRGQRGDKLASGATDKSSSLTGYGHRCRVGRQPHLSPLPVLTTVSQMEVLLVPAGISHPVDNVSVTTKRSSFLCSCCPLCLCLFCLLT